jgi:hypothetical protein
LPAAVRPLAIPICMLAFLHKPLQQRNQLESYNLPSLFDYVSRDRAALHSSRIAI